MNKKKPIEDLTNYEHATSDNQHIPDNPLLQYVFYSEIDNLRLQLDQKAEKF